MLSLWKRHLKSCPHKDIYYRRCACPVWAQGAFQGEFIRKSLDTRSWERGIEIIREWEDSQNAEVLDIEAAGLRFLEDAKARHLSAETQNKYKFLFREMAGFFGTKELNGISVDDLSAYRESWKLAPITALKKFERVKAFLSFSKARGWVKENRAVFLKTPKVTFAPTLPFTKEEFEKLMWATEVYPLKGIYGERSRRRIKTFVMTLRYTGLRIRDVIRLKREHVSGGKIQLYTQKTGQQVYIPIPPDLEKILGETRGEPYLFWSGLGNEKSCVGDWQRSLRRLGKLAGVHVHAHRFRDTFSVSLLEAGVPIETVSVLLGHSGIKITEKHYSPWVKSRQENLEKEIRKTWV